MRKLTGSLGVLLGLASCSVTSQFVPRDILYVNYWIDYQANFYNMDGEYVSTAVTTETINPSLEKIEEFTTFVGKDGMLYLAYASTDNISETIELSDNGTEYTNKIKRKIETLNYHIDIEIIKIFTNKSGSTTKLLKSVSTNSINEEQKWNPNTGVWVRLLKFNRNLRAENPWELQFVTKVPMPLSEIKAISIPGHSIPYIAAVSNKNRLAIFGTDQKEGNIRFIHSPNGLNLHEGRNPRSVKQLSFWNNGDRLYGAMIEDNISYIGYVRNSVWQTDYNNIWGNTPEIFEVAQGATMAYGVWWSTTDRVTTIAGYLTNGVLGQKWLLIDNLRATENPSIRSRIYTDVNGMTREGTFIGTIYSTSKFFQLSRIDDNRIKHIAPPVDGYNERYSFDIDKYGRVLYTRINTENTIDVAGFTRDLWIESTRPEYNQSSSGIDRVQYKTHPNSTIETFFIDNIYPHVVFVNHLGNIQFLEGRDRGTI